jgi:tetraacyldisaccharide 4'-kinase
MKKNPEIKKNPLLYPASLIYGAIVALRNKLFDLDILKSREFDIPVISVGNITVGGTGKTPHVEYLIKLLKKDFKVASLSRGYKRKSKGFHYVKTDSPVEEVGDEPLQIKLKNPDIPIAVEGNRVKGINKLKSDHNDLNVILLDDAFQHRYVKPGISILLIDYHLPIWEDSLMPYGRIRERWHQMKRANIIIFTKCPDKIKPINRRLMIKNLNPFPYQKVFFTTFSYGPIKPVFPGVKTSLSLETLKEEKANILIITGIANPRQLKKYIRGFSPRLAELKYPDHHTFSRKDLNEITSTFNKMKGNRKIMITTEKDGVRLKKFTSLPDEIKHHLYYIPVTVKFLENGKEEFDKHVIRYARSNKPHNILFQ